MVIQMEVNTTTKILFFVTLILQSSLSKAEITNYNVDVISSQSDSAFFTATKAINNSGQVVGIGYVDGTLYPLRWNINDGSSTLANPGVAGGINDLGQVSMAHPFRVYDSDGTELYSHDVYDSIGTDINNNTQVAGVAIFEGDTYGHAFLWDESTGMEDLGTLGGEQSYGHAINDNCYIVGRSSIENGGCNIVSVN